MRIIIDLIRILSETIDVVTQLLKSLNLSVDRLFEAVLLIVTVAAGWFFSRDKATKKRDSGVDCDDYVEQLTVRVPATGADMRAANEALKNILGGKHFVTLDQYKALIAKNHTALTVIADENDEMVGYFDVFPLINTFGRDFMDGHVGEKQFTPDKQHNKETSDGSNFIYIGAIFNLEKDNTSKRHCVSLFLQERLILHLLSLYPPRSQRVYMALASSDEGKRLLKAYKFTHYQDRRDRKDKCDLFILDHGHFGEAEQKIRKRFAKRGDSIFDCVEGIKSNIGQESGTLVAPR